MINLDALKSAGLTNKRLRNDSRRDCIHGGELGGVHVTKRFGCKDCCKDGRDQGQACVR